MRNVFLVLVLVVSGLSVQGCATKAPGTYGSNQGE